MKKSFIILSFIAAFASANAQVSWGLTNHSSYQCGYRDGYQNITLWPGMSSFGNDPAATLPMDWYAQYIDNSSEICSASGSHREPIGPTAVKLSCSDPNNPKVYILYAIYYDSDTKSYFITIDFYDK